MAGVLGCSPTESVGEPETTHQIRNREQPAVGGTSEPLTTPTTDADIGSELTDGATFVVGGPFPDGSLAYLDADGSVLRYGGPKADTFVDSAWSAVCPGQAAVVGIRDHQSLWIRDLGTGDAREVDLSDRLGDGYVVATSCRSSDGNTLLAVVGRPSSDHVQMDLWEISGEEHRLVTKVSDESVPMVNIVGDHVFVTEHFEEGERLTALDVTTAEVTMVEEVPAGTEFSMTNANPSQSEVIVSVGAWNSGDPDSFILRVDLDPWRIDRLVEFADREGAATWVDDVHAMVSFAYGGPNEPDVAGPDVSIVDVRNFTPVGEVVEWPGVSSALFDGALWGITGGKLVRGDLETGDVEVVTTLPATTFGPILLLEND